MADCLEVVRNGEALPAPEFLNQVYAEVLRARAKFPRPQVNLHEGYAVLLEEVDEFWELVRSQKPDPSTVLHELVQIAAMAMRTAEEVIGSVPAK